MPKVITVRIAFTKNAMHKYHITLGICSLAGQRPVPLLVKVLQGLASSKRSSATGSFVYLFQKLTRPVIKATRKTSSIGHFLIVGMRRNVLAHILDALMKRAPRIPPRMPSKMKAIISKNCQSVR